MLLYGDQYRFSQLERHLLNDVPPNPTTSPALSSSSWNVCLPPIMSHENPLIRYYDWCFAEPIENICKEGDFVLWYPFSGSSHVSLLPRSSWNFGCLSRRIL